MTKDFEYNRLRIRTSVDLPKDCKIIIMVGYIFYIPDPGSPRIKNMT
jgi:hypothetical protein